MQNIAYFVGSKKAKPGFAKDKELVALGEKIYRGGIADRQVRRLRRLPQPQRRRHPGPVPAPVRPACRLHRRPSWWPSATARARTAPQMTQVAAKLNDREIKAVADYIAGLR